MRAPNCLLYFDRAQIQVAKFSVRDLMVSISMLQVDCGPKHFRGDRNSSCCNSRITILVGSVRESIMKIASLLRSVLAALVVAFAARSVPAQEAMRVAIPLFPTVAFPVLVGADKGFFHKEGLIIEPIRINSAPTTYQALISGDVHAVVGAPTGLLPSNLQGADIVSVGSWDNLVPYVWVTREK